MTRTELKKLIDDLGGLRAEQTSLNAAERSLSGQVREAMKKAKLSAIEAAQYSAQLAERRTLRIDPAAFRKRAGESVFLACARIDVKAARAKVDAKDLDRCGDYATRLELRVSRIPGKTE